MPRIRHLVIAAISILVLTTFAQAQGAPAGGVEWKGKTPIGLPDVNATAPKDNALTQAKVVLGKALFWDKRLSSTGMHSCQSCHSPEKGWSDTVPVSMKATGKANTRHSPSLYNVAYNTAFFFDGRAQTLESAVRMEWEDQLGAKGRADAIAQKFDGIPGYKKLFEEAFGPGAASADKVCKAIASFTRTILTANSPYDHFAGGSTSAMSEAAQRGWDLFRGKARCGVCHSGNLFTDGKFHMIGIGHGGLVKGDPWRMAIL
jgi:cytochrome c peroxidase